MIVSTEQVINRTKMRLGLHNTENDGYLEKLINEGATSLKNFDCYVIKCAELDIDDCGKAKLPDFFEEFLGGTFANSGCNCGSCSTFGVNIAAPGSIDTVYRPPCSCPQFFVATPLVNSWCFPATCGAFGSYFNINGNYLTFPSTITATSIKITYRSQRVDDDGMMILNEDWERGLSAYAAFQFATDFYSSYQPEQRSRWEREWVMQKAYQKGASQFKKFKLDKHSIYTIMNAVYYNGSMTGILGGSFPVLP